MSRGWAGGSTRAHRRARAYVLARDNRRCQLKVPGVCTTVATCAHHVLGKAVTGDDPAHMIASCTACNLKVGDPRKLDPAPRPKEWW